MRRSRKYQDKRKVLGDSLEQVDALTALTRIKEVAQDWESVDLDVRLGVDPRKAEQNVRGTTALPHGTGKVPVVVVFCKEDKLEEAKEAGADYAGLDDLFEKISAGWVEFDTAIATPDVMRNVAKVAKILGPRGLMPNPKSGTVTPDIKAAVEAYKSGKVEYRTDKAGIIHTTVGRVGFDVLDLKANVDHMVGVILKAKPASLKGLYVKSLSVSSTQSPSMRLDLSGFSS